jgi:hypothetical protein
VLEKRCGRERRSGGDRRNIKDIENKPQTERRKAFALV